jgi:DNA (cytosine-5)-methyltransferase 1
MHSRSIDSPVPTISAGGGHVGIADMTIDPIIDRFTLGQQSGSVARSVDRPLPTISTGGAIALVESELTPTSFIAEYYGNGGAQSTDDPLNTVTTRDRFGLVEPMVLPVTHHGGENRVRSTDDPLPTITGARRGELALAEPFIVPQFGERPTQGPRTHSLDAPLPAITSHGAGALVEPLIDSGADTMPGGRLVRINGVVYRIDIRFRMLKPKELARAMGFSDDETEYEFVGTGEQVVKQIGNAVPVNTASALVGALITG